MVLHELLNILVCPACKGRLLPDDGTGTLRCPPCGLAFPIKEGIPVMLVDEAKNIESQKAGGASPVPGCTPGGRTVINQ